MARMVIDLFYSDGATPLDLNEIEGLIPLHMSTQAELNEWEQENILEAVQWLSKHQWDIEKILDLDFIKQAHLKMFNKTWKWAGAFRKTNKNIGVDWPLIGMQTKQLLDDINYQILQNTYSLDEIAARFHHRLVWIHPFANGNGRHARLVTDQLLIAKGHPPFSWGRNNIQDMVGTRKKYIKSLKAADQHDYHPLLDFVRS